MHNDTTIIDERQSFRKYIPLTLLKGLCVRGSWRPTKTATFWPSLYWPSPRFFPFSWAAQPGAWGPTLLGAGFLYRILSPTGLVSKLTDFLSSPSYIIVQRPLLVGVTIAFIQPIHGQSYNSDIPRPDAPVIYTGASGRGILTARPGRRSIYNNSWLCLHSLIWRLRH